MTLNDAGINIELLDCYQDVWLKGNPGIVNHVAGLFEKIPDISTPMFQQLKRRMK